MAHVGTSYKRFEESDAYDALVVGSGVGGLVTAALLAEHGGLRVLVLERHHTVGGFSQTFRRPGFAWDVGVHYVGQLNDPASPLRAVLDHVTGGALAWADMGEVYDTFIFGEDEYRIPRGKSQLRRMLISRFPAEARGIDQYFSRVAAVVRWSEPYFAEKLLPASLSRLFGPALRYPFLRHARRSTAEVVAACVSDARLRAVLTGQWGNYGLPPSASSFGMHALLVNHYFGGGSYPVGGSARIAETIVPMIERGGGAVLTGAEVQSILVEGGSRAVGVRLKDGREFRAAAVVSDAGSARTFGALLPQTSRVKQGVAVDVTPSRAHIGLYLGVQGTAEELGLRKSNLWVFAGYDHESAPVHPLERPDAPFPVVFISFPGAKDPDFQRRHPGVSTVEAIAFAPYEWFRAWEERPWLKRDAAYQDLKRCLTERLLATVYRTVPTLNGRVIHAELSTPLSTRHFTGHAHGEIYGLAHTPSRFDARLLRSRTPIEGLFLCGADVVTCGVAGAAMSGVLAASAVLGKLVLLDIIRRQGALRRGRRTVVSRRQPSGAG